MRPMLFREERFVKPIDLPALKFRSALSVFARFLKGDLRIRFREKAKGFFWQIIPNKSG